MWDLWNEDGTRMKMSGSNGGEVMAVMSGDLSEDSDEEQAGAPCGRVKWLATTASCFTWRTSRSLGSTSSRKLVCQWVFCEIYILLLLAPAPSLRTAGTRASRGWRGRRSGMLCALWGPDEHAHCCRCE